MLSRKLAGLSRRPTSCRNCLKLPCPTVPYRALPCPTVPYRALPCPTVPYRALPCSSRTRWRPNCLIRTRWIIWKAWSSRTRWREKGKVRSIIKTIDLSIFLPSISRPPSINYNWRFFVEFPSWVYCC
jgi:hypothetical protein